MPIYQSGSLNTTALVVPGLYVQIVPPQTLVLNGVPSNTIGVVGSAQWGPVNVPTIVGSYAQYFANFGNMQSRKYDMGTHVGTAVQQGAQSFKCVRVTDGTDVAATIVVQTTCITFTAKYTGSLGNQITVQLATGTAASSTKAIVGLPGFPVEIYDNVSGSGNAFWVALAAAINNGQSPTNPFRGPSQLITASAGAGTAAPTLATLTLATGADGVSAVTATTLLGTDGTTRTGMYALRNQGCSVGVLADDDTSSNWNTVAGFGLSEGIYFVGTSPSGDTISNAISTLQTSGATSYAYKHMFGDWVYYNDPVNQVTRLVSPQGYVAGRLGNLSPQNSSLNKQLYGIAGTQKSGQVVSGQPSVYSYADLQSLFAAGVDVIMNPSAGGPYYATGLGHNTSSNPATSGDNYTRMTNYIAATLNAGMGLYVGQVINPTLLQQIRATLLTFFQNLLQQGLLGMTFDANGNPAVPFSVVCDSSNNPQSRTSLGYVQADCQVQYQAINEKFIVNLEGGQTVVVQRQTLPSGQVP